MSTAVVQGLFGIGGLVAGGVIATISAVWQSASSRKSRLAELELQFSHERVLRDEQSTQSVILEMIGLLQSLTNVIFITVMAHNHYDHDNWPESPCNLKSMKNVVSAATAFYEFNQKKGAMIDDSVPLGLISEAWDYLYLVDPPVRDYDYFTEDDYENAMPAEVRNQYCDISMKIACLQVPISKSINCLKKQLKIMRAVRENLTYFGSAVKGLNCTFNGQAIPAILVLQP